MRNITVKKMATTAMIAALYFALSLPFMTLNFGAVQLRIAESLTLLPVFAVSPIGGLVLGCVLVNAFGALSGASILGTLDIVIGSAATLLAAFLSYQLRKLRVRALPLASALAPVLVNGLVIGLELTLVINGGWNLGIFFINFGQVAFGEAIACYCLGIPLVRALEKAGLAKQLFSEKAPYGQNPASLHKTV